MNETFRESMSDRMAALCTNITTLNMSADELIRSANLLSDRPASQAMRDIARRQRVKILEMQGQLAALNVTYTDGLARTRRPAGADTPR